MKHPQIDPGYYWILILNSGKFSVAEYKDGKFLPCGDTRPIEWEMVGQLGEEIPDNSTLYYRRLQNESAL